MIDHLLMDNVASESNVVTLFSSIIKQGMSHWQGIRYLARNLRSSRSCQQRPITVSV